MTNRKQPYNCTERIIKSDARMAVMMLLCVASTTCTDAGLYQIQRDPFVANKLTVKGTVCSDDPRQRAFPVKILFLIDVSAPLAADKNDPTGFRGKAVDDVISFWSQNSNYSFGVVAFAGQARNLIDEGFTRDAAKLSTAAIAAQSNGGIAGVGGCIGGRCRDLRAALSLASSIITGDVLATDPGTVSRTSYITILFSGGAPVPAIGRCACRDKQTETLPENWQGCPWTECDGCKVTCPTNATCKDTECFPTCIPECSGDQFCDIDYLCKDKDDTFTGNPTVPPISSQPTSIADTFTQWLLPVQHNLNLSGINIGGVCKMTCVFPAGGHPDSCEERTMVAAVREIATFTKDNGAAQFQFHATYLPDRETHAPTDLFAPPCADPTGDEARAVRLLSEMAYAGGGGFKQFGQDSAIGFTHINLHTNRDPLVIKELIVSNGNVLVDASGMQADTDQDGLSDQREQTLGTCLSRRDTDGDGISDAIELKIASDPLKGSEPVECVDIEATSAQINDACSSGTSIGQTRYIDVDQDRLNACEERLLGTNDTLFDSDADGFPDSIEFLAGTNYLAVDPLQDSDFDGVINRNELRGHTDPRSNDAQTQLDLAYQYEEIDEGIKSVHSFSQPTTLTGVTIKSVSPATSPGVGLLKFDPGPPATMAFRDSGDMGPGGNFGAAVDVSRPNRDGYVLVSQPSKDRSITVLAEGSSQYGPKAAVDKIVISSADRNCLRFSVRNITLMETGTDPELGTTGNNVIYIHFAQAPKAAKDSFGIFKTASIRTNYHRGPPETRTPKVAEITLRDDDFVLQK